MQLWFASPLRAHSRSSLSGWTGLRDNHPRCVLRQKLLGESGILGRIETNLDGCMAPINPASWMPIADLAIAHKHVETLCQAVDTKHSVLDWKRHCAFRGGGHDTFRHRSTIGCCPKTSIGSESTQIDRGCHCWSFQINRERLDLRNRPPNFDDVACVLSSDPGGPC